MNQITIAGHLGADPEVRFTSSGQKVTTLRVATRAKKEETIWWKVTVWGDQFDKMIGYFKKGSSIMVTGEVNKPEIFNDKEGRPQVSMSITAIMLYFSPFGKGGDGSSSQSHQAADREPAYAASSDQSNFGKGQSQESFGDDDIPF